MPLPDVHSNRYFETRVVEQPMEDILDAFLGLVNVCLIAFISSLQKSVEKYQGLQVAF